MEKSIFELLNEIDDNFSLTERFDTSATQKTKQLSEVVEEDEYKTEGLFGSGKKKNSTTAKGSSNKGDVERKVTFKVWDPNGSLRYNHTFTELPGKMTAELQFRDLFKDTNDYKDYCKNNPRDWTYERVSVPESGLDTKNKPGKRHFLSADIL